MRQPQLNSFIFIFNMRVCIYIEGGEGFADALLDELVCDSAGRVLIKDRIHQGDLGCAASGFGLCWAKLLTNKLISTE